MNKATIMILGDSTSATYGVEEEMYPYHLAKLPHWPKNCRILSCAQPGITAADAANFFFRHQRDAQPLLAVIIHLGTCDSVAVELRKGRFTPGKQVAQWLRRMRGKPYARPPLKNRLLRQEWNAVFSPKSEKPDSPADFEYNIRRVVTYCHKKRVPVLMIQPTGHIEFPAGIGKGNFDFYQYIGFSESVTDSLSAPDSRLREAIMLQDQRCYVDAKSIYQKMLEDPGPMSDHPEYALICTHNYAVCCAESGEIDEARYLLELLLKESQIRSEIVLFNLAQLARLYGDEKTARRMLMDAYELDLSMYRIKEPYRNRIAELAMEFSSTTRLIDLKTIVADSEFVDHCHPLPVAQRRIAQVVAGEMRDIGIKGSFPAHIENRLYNPELAFGETRSFHQYFKTYAPYSSQQIVDWVMALKERLGADGDLQLDTMKDIPFEMRRAVEQHLRHPCFPKAKDLLHCGPERPGDIGRFPELFLVRHVIPFLASHQSDPELNNRFDRELALLRPVDSLMSLLPEDMLPLEGVNLGNSLFDDPNYPLRVLHAVKSLLMRNLQRGNQITSRLKNTIYWYFRESLRFGAHSRISMRYQRIELEFAAEALAIVGVVGNHQKRFWTVETISLIKSLESLTQIHERFCSRFDPGADNSSLMTDYDYALAEAGDRIATIAIPQTV